jgi:glucose/arabinose dehydrogenase
MLSPVSSEAGRRRIVAAASLLTLAACGGGGGGGQAAQPPPTGTPPPTPEPVSVVAEAVFPSLSFDSPVALLQAPGDDRRWFVVEQAGTVRVFDNEQDADTSSVFADITSLVSFGGEAGLLGLAFAPDFSTSGVAYLSYTGRPGGTLTSIVARYRSLDGGQTLDGSTAEVLLEVIQDFGNHNGGQIAFGPDGLLYLGMGDGGSGNDPNNRAQDTTNLLGAMLRIDVDGGTPYAIPADNPFAGNAPCVQGFGGAPCPEIFAWGLRNPWRWSFDRRTGRLWAGDVGQSDREEIDVVRLGGNYGWRIREGAQCNDNIQPSCDPTGLTDPFWDYGRSQGQSVTGGYVYRGGDIPTLAGSYVFGDFVSGRIWSIPTNGTEPATELTASGLLVAAFGEDAAGEIYVVDYRGGLYRLVEARP